MRCPKCGYESPWANTEVFSKSNPCIACGFDMGGAEFYGEASSEYVAVKPEEKKGKK